MTDPNPASRSSPEPANHVDPKRLKKLLVQAVSLQSAGEESCVELVLKQLDETDRERYRRPLLDELENAGSDQPQSRSADPSLEETIDEASSSSVAKELASTDPTSIPRQNKSVLPAERAPVRQEEVPTLASDTGDAKPLPERIDKFRVVRELGRGGFGVVYLGVDEELQRKVALKVTHVSDPILQERLRVEASKVAQIESPGIVPVYHIGKTDDGNVYIVQKYIQGSTVRGLLTKSPLPPLISTEIVRDVALGLEPAHLQNILHRDLKPENVLIDETGQAWIADFGLAISEEEQEGCPREFTGTPPYMAPEQISGRIDFMDPRSDIWALGVMYYEMLTGRRPFRGKDHRTLKEQICELDPRPLHQRDPDHLTEAMNAIFLRCCAKRPSDRYATAGELADALDGLIADGLWDDSAAGEPGKAAADDLLVKYARSRRTSRRISDRESKPENVASKPPQGVLTRWLPTWIQGVAGLLAVITLSIMGSIGYQMYLHSANRSDVNTANGDSVSPDAANLAAGTATPQRSQGDAGMDTQDSDAADADIGQGTNSLGLDQADGSDEKPWIVARDGSGSHRTISAALAASSPHLESHPDPTSTRTHIRVNPGDYHEAIRITRPVTIEGVPEKVSDADGQDRYPCQVVNGQDTPLLIDITATPEIVELKYLTITNKHHDAKRESSAVDLTAGTLVMRDCDLGAVNTNCIKVRSGARLATFDCEFRDSLQFAISTDEHNQVVAVDSDFYGSGIQLKGGTGRISGCKFFGPEGIRVSQSDSVVNVEHCEFTANSGYGIAVANHGSAISKTNSFLDCKKGIWVVVDGDVDDDGPADDHPTKLQLVNTSLIGCDTAVEVEGGTLIATGNCRIEKGGIGLVVTTGTVTLTDMHIADLTEHGLSVSDMADVTLQDCTLERTDAAAIQLSKGDLTVSGGRIAGYKAAGIIVGRESHWPLATAKCRLQNVKVSEPNAPAIIAFSGPVTLENVTLAGGTFGLMAIGPEVSELGSPPLVEIRMDKSCSFLNQKEAGIFGKGDARITLNSKSWRALSDEKGAKAKVLRPASIEFD